MNVAIACSGFIDYCERERQLAANTLAAYRQDLAEFQRFFSGRLIGEIAGANLVTYSQHLSITRNLAPATVKRRLACLRAMFVRLLRQRLISENPFASVDLRVRIPSKLPRCLTTSDARLLLQNAEKACLTTRLAMALLFTTGVRVGELASIRLDDIDIEQRSVRIFGKGSRERQVFLSDDQLVSLIQDYIATKHHHQATSRRLLINARERPTTPACLRRRIMMLARKAGIAQHVTPHMFRHTAATALVEAGIDIRFVQRLLGHQTIATTQIYTHVSDRALKAAIVSANVFHRLRGSMGSGGAA